MVGNVNRALPQVRIARLPSVAICTGATGRLRVISDSSRPRTTTVPASSACTSSVACADTS
jgi:hypothetical protein